MNNLAIIPARGGSKRIVKKNIKDFFGKPIIAYSIEKAKESGLFDEIMVSTDDFEIAEIAIKYGATVPFMRSDKNSSEFATTAEVISEVLDYYDNIQRFFKNVCCIYATSPLLKIENLQKANNLLGEMNVDSVFPIVKHSSPIQRAFRLDDSKFVSMFYPEHINTRSQDLENAYSDAGQFYFFKSEGFKKNRKIITSNSKVIIIDNMESQDIDELSDWELAEMKFQRLNKNLS